MVQMKFFALWSMGGGGLCFEVYLMDNKWKLGCLYWGLGCFGVVD